MPLVEVVQKLSFARDLAAVQEIVRHAARSLTGADGATLVLREHEKCFYVDEDAIAPLWKGMRFPIETCVSGWSMLHRQAAVVPDIYADARVPADAYRRTFVKSLAMVPIRRMDPIGAIGSYWATRHEATDEEIQLLQALADTTAVAIENVRVYSELEQRVRERTRELEAANDAIRNLSLLDDLTGLYNRRGFYLLAEQSHKAARRDGTDQFIAYVDADGLKQVNDAKGHHAGDELLKSLAGILKHVFREADVIARLGGDEFCVLGAAHGDTHAISQRLSKAIAAFNEQAGALGFRLSASCGISTWAVGTDASVDDIIGEADEAMYVAKRAVRHCSMADPPPAPN
jgi:diguanylate cyclase (GGDEF)-like protein